MQLFFDSSPVGRNTKLSKLTILGEDGKDVTLWFSYDTVVALFSANGKFRRKNVWGPTTGRHMREAGVMDWKEVDEEEMDRQLSLLKMHTKEDVMLQTA